MVFYALCLAFFHACRPIVRILLILTTLFTCGNDLICVTLLSSTVLGKIYKTALIFSFQGGRYYYACRRTAILPNSLNVRFGNRCSSECINTLQISFWLDVRNNV